LNKKKKFTFIDLFGVPGGMSLGFEMAGFRSVGALDMFKEGLMTYGRNFPHVPSENIVNADASKPTTLKKFVKQTGLKKGDVDVIIGGPPCQGFSSVGRIQIAELVKKGIRKGRSTNPRFISDPRNNLYKSFVKFVDFYKPKFLVMENVQGMMSYKDGWAVEQIKEDLKNIGYKNVQEKILNAVDYGAPQYRKRIFFIASLNNKKIQWPDITHFENDGNDRTLLSPDSKTHVTVMDAISDLPRLEIPERGKKIHNSILEYRKDPVSKYQKWVRNGSKTVQNNVTRWHRDIDIEIFSTMKPGDRWKDLPKHYRKKIGYNDESFNDKWKRLPRNKPSHTVVAHLQKDGYMFIHPTQNRTISVREAARLQSFPDSFVFLGGRAHQFRQIGNAVPPLLAKAIAKKIFSKM